MQCNPILESPVYLKQLVNSLPEQFREISGKRGKQEQGLGFPFWLQCSGECGSCHGVAVHCERAALLGSLGLSVAVVIKSQLFDTT